MGMILERGRVYIKMGPSCQRSELSMIPLKLCKLQICVKHHWKGILIARLSVLVA